MYASAVFGQQKVAVYVTGSGDAGIKKVLGDQLTAAIVKSGKYVAIERTNSFLAELNKEQGYQRTGVVDDKELSRLGKQFGVQLVCVAEINDVFNAKYVSARLLEVESAEVISASSTTSPLKDMQELLKVSQYIATELMQDKAAESAKEKAEKQGYLVTNDIDIQINVLREVKWRTANKMAKRSTLAGYHDWRLPTVAEMPQIKSVYNKLVNPKSSKAFWTSVKCTKNNYKAHYILYGLGQEYGCYSDDEKINVILVRTIEKNNSTKK
jgi:hypothetical protein